MPTLHLIWRTFSEGIWLKGPRENNPSGTLRRAKSVFPLRTGSVRSRSGSTVLSTLVPHSLFKAFGRRILGVGGQIWREVASVFTQLVTGVPALNGNPLSFATAPPTVGAEDVVFVAGGGNLFKINAALTTASTWGIARPSDTPPSIGTAALTSKDIDASTSTIANWTATDMSDTSAEGATDTTPTANASLAASPKKVTTNGSLTVVAPKDATTRVDRVIALDLSQFAAPGDSGDEDLIELWFACNRPQHIKNLELVFYLGSAPPAAPFDNETSTYHRELQVKIVSGKQKGKLRGLGDILPRNHVKQIITDSSVTIRDFDTSAEVSEDVIGVTRRTWTRVVLPKSSFTLTQAPGTTFTWANVQGVRLSVETNKLGKSRVWLDRIRMIGGVGLQGDYQYMFTFANLNTQTRSNPSPQALDTKTNSFLYAPLTITSIERTGVNLGLLAGATPLPAPFDLQTTHLEVWRTVGGGTDFFLVDQIASTVGAPATGYLDKVADYPGMFSGGGGTKFLQAVELPDDNDRPKDTVVDVAGPVYGRLFLCTRLDNRVWYSPAGRCETIANYTEVGSSNAPVTNVIGIAVGATNEIVQRIIVWNAQLYALTQQHLYRCLTTDEPFVFVEVSGSRGTVLPRTVVATPWGLMYQANDGVRGYDGMASELIGADALSPIFRGGSSDGLGPFVGSVAAYGRNEYYISDGSTTTLAWSPDGGWRNVGIATTALFYEDDTGVLLSTAKLSAAPIQAVVIRQTGGFTLGTASPFTSLGSGGVVTTEAAAQSLVLLDTSTSGPALTFTKMYVRLSANVAAGSVTFQLYVNGVIQAGLTVTIASGSSTGNASGSVTALDGQTISLGTTFAGGATAAVVQAITLGCTVS